jgi:type II secretory pathway component PulC
MRALHAAAVWKDIVLDIKQGTTNQTEALINYIAGKQVSRNTELLG